jgi:hypothetical protein
MVVPSTVHYPANYEIKIAYIISGEIVKYKQTPQCNNIQQIKFLLTKNTLTTTLRFVSENICLEQCFPARFLWNPRVPQNIVRVSSGNREKLNYIYSRNLQINLLNNNLAVIDCAPRYQFFSGL